MAARAVPKRQYRLLTQAIERWRADGVVTPEAAQALRGSITPAPFDWRRVARYSFVIAVVCLVIAVSAALADRWLLEMLARLFTAPAVAKSLGLTALAVLLFVAALRRRARAPGKVYSTEALFFLGVLAVAGAVGFLAEASPRVSAHYSLLFLLATILYLLLGLGFPSRQVWIFGLLSLGGWMGTETGYMSGWGAYFLGMNYPLRFVLFGAALTLLGLAAERLAADPAAPSPAGRLRSLAPPSKVVGLLYLFIALWIMSIFGNYDDVARWQHASSLELAHWSVLFGVVALAAIAWGLREDDAVCRGFGLTFLGINLYTRFFEYFWNSLHKAVFFAILAASFWLLGTRAEKIWRLGEPRGGDAPKR